MKRLAAVFFVAPANKNHEGYLAVSGSPIGQLFAPWRRIGRQDGVDVILVDQLE